MFENWNEVIVMSKLKNDALLQEAHNIRMIKEKKGTHESSRVSIYLLGGLGKAFSSLGDSLQSHYHFDNENKHIRKVS